MQVPSSSVGPHNAKKNPTILTESTDHDLDKEGKKKRVPKKASEKVLILF